MDEMKNSVKAVILVGGEGTRLRPLTYHTPKSMVPVLNVPFLEHVLLNLRDHHITEIILAQHHLPDSMKEYFGDGSKFGVSLLYVMEDSPRGSAGAVKNAERYLKETFLVLNGDIFHNRNFTDMLAFHKSKHAKVTLDLAPVEDPTVYGMVETDEQGKVKRFLEKPSRDEITTNLINAGTWVIDPKVLKTIPPDIKCSFEKEIFPRMLEDGDSIFAYPSYRYWMDTGTPEKYLQLHRDLLSGKCDNYPFEKNVIGEGCKIHPTAQLEGKIMLGDNCSLGRGVRLAGPVVIGPDCMIDNYSVITDSVIWHNVRIGQIATVKSSILADNCTIGDDSYLIDSVLGDHVTISNNCKLKPGSRIMPGEIVKES